MYGDEQGLTNAVCKSCAPGKYNDQSGQSACDDCPNGFFQANDGQIACDTCPVGRYGDESGMNLCKTCAAGQYEDETGQSSCEDCPIAFYQMFVGQSNCNECAAGTYSDETGQATCDACPSGWGSAEGQSACVELCLAGTYGSAGQCNDCSAGMYGDEQGLTNAVCKECPVGYKNPSSGQASCAACSTRTHQDETGQTACKYCAAGRYQNQNAQETCHACSYGHFQSQTGQRDCDDQCPSGTYQDVLGQASCKDCEAGMYQSASGSHYCNSCPTGWDSTADHSSCTATDSCDGAGLTNAGAFCYTASNVVCTSYTTFTNKGFGYSEEQCRQLCINDPTCDTFNYGIGGNYVGRCALYEDCNLQTSSPWVEGWFNYIPVRLQKLRHIHGRQMWLKRTTYQHMNILCKDIWRQLSGNIYYGVDVESKIAPECSTPVRRSSKHVDVPLSDAEKTEIVLSDPRFGMLSLFRYHVTRGREDAPCKQNNTAYCSHLFSRWCALPLLVLFSQWGMYLALVIYHAHARGLLVSRRFRIRV